MIVATGIHRANHLLIEINFPGSTKKEFKTIYGETPELRVAEVRKLLCRLNKNRICETMSRWLKQRQFALDSYDRARSVEAARLLVLLNYYNNFDYFKICKMVAENRQAVESIAPGTQSKFFNYYNVTIRGILAECDFMKGRSI